MKLLDEMMSRVVASQFVKVINVATIAFLDFDKDTLEGLDVELDIFIFEDGTDDDVNNCKDIHENIDLKIDKFITTFGPRASG